MTTKNIQLGAKVFLRACSGVGEPGTIVRQERGKLVVHWKDLNVESRHKPEALEITKESR
jgi:hypothetical protein